MQSHTSHNSRSRRTLRAWRDETGASAVEYALIVAGIAAVIVAIVFALGSVLNSSVHKSCNNLENHFDGTTATCDNAN